MADPRGTKVVHRYPATIPVDAEIELRILQPDHAPALYALVDANRAHLRPWMGWVDGTRSVDDLHAFIDRALAQAREDNGFQTGIWYRRELAGTIGLNFVDWRNRKASVGYWLSEDRQGKGIMTRACRALVDFAFDKLDLNRVEILVAPGNERSRAIPVRLGFTQEGVTRESERLYERYEDSVIYGLLRRDRSGKPT